MNPKITISIDAKNKAISSITGIVSVGALVDVEISGLPDSIPDWAATDKFTGKSLRLRIVDGCGHDIVRYPLNEKTTTPASSGDTWTVGANNVYTTSSGCTVNFDTHCLRNAFCCVPFDGIMEFGVILDSVVDSAEYAIGHIKIRQWSHASTEDPTILPDWREVLAKLKDDLEAVEESKEAAETAATNAATSEANAHNSEIAAQVYCSSAVSAAASASNSAANAASSASSASASAASALVSANSANASASAASASQSSAATSASNASTSEHNAAASATTASIASTSAGVSAANSAVSAASASASATSAASSAAEAEEKASHYPMIGENGNWWFWDQEASRYEDSGRSAIGFSSWFYNQTDGRYHKVVVEKNGSNEYVLSVDQTGYTNPVREFVTAAQMDLYVNPYIDDILEVGNIIAKPVTNGILYISEGHDLHRKVVNGKLYLTKEN